MLYFQYPPTGDIGRFKMNEEHNHNHHHQDTQKVINRMSRVIGHMESIKRMVEEGRDCSEILIQLSAVRAAINNVGKIVLQDHINNCLVEAIEAGDKKPIEDLNNAIGKALLPFMLYWRHPFMLSAHLFQKSY